MTGREKAAHLMRREAVRLRRINDIALAKRLAEKGYVDSARAILRKLGVDYAAVELYPTLLR